MSIQTKTNAYKIFPIVLTHDSGYTQYSSVVLHNLCKFSVTENVFYKIYIVSNDLTLEDKNYLLKVVNRVNNPQVSLEFINLSNIQNVFASLQEHITISTYFRILLPLIFTQYDRILYLDCDVTVCIDPYIFAQFDQSMEHQVVIGKPDSFCYNLVNGYIEDVSELDYVQMTSVVNKKGYVTRTNFTYNPRYYSNYLRMDYIGEYINAGVLYFNLKYLRQLNQTHSLLLASKMLPNVVFSDQCYINYVNKRLSKDHQIGFIPNILNRFLSSLELAASALNPNKIDYNSFWGSLQYLAQSPSLFIRCTLNFSYNPIENPDIVTYTPELKRTFTTPEYYLQVVDKVKKLPKYLNKFPVNPNQQRYGMIFHFLSSYKPWKIDSLHTVNWWGAVFSMDNAFWYVNNQQSYNKDYEKIIYACAEFLYGADKIFSRKYGENAFNQIIQNNGLPLITYNKSRNF